MFLDASIVLDVLLERHPFVVESKRVWAGSDVGAFDGHIAAFTLTTIHYVCEKHVSPEAADRAVDVCLEAFEIAALYRECIVAARRMSGPDFEDNLQIACALTDFMEAIVTRNPDDFRASPIRVYTPVQFLAELRLP